MHLKYAHALAPLRIGGVVLKNRFLATKGLPHFLQGPETFPDEKTIRYYGNLARNGAAIVTVKGMDSPLRNRAKLEGDMRHMSSWDLSDPAVHNYFAQIADTINYYGSVASINIQKLQPPGCNISALTREDVWRIYGKGKANCPVGTEMTREQIAQLKSMIVERVKLYKSLGFGAVNLYMCYKNTILACSMSPLVNKRTDEYGGSVENRARLILELCSEIKAACGRDFIIEIQFSGEEGVPGGYTVDDTIELLRLGEGLIDIIHIRACNGDLSHPVGLNSTKESPLTLKYAEAIKSAGVKVITAPNGGFQDLELIDRWIAEGKTDMVAMCRSFICDFDYYEKALEGRGEDVVPCIRCNNCHGISTEGPWRSFCSVNPVVGIQSRLDLLAPGPVGEKKVAVIGGGPAGMRAALVARQRGHKVTVYEKSGVLGGQLTHADYADFKWPLKEYKDWLISQLSKQGVEVRLNTEPSREQIASECYDAIIAATGAVPKRLSLPGADSPGIWSPLEVFGRESELGEHVVIVGGGETGVETGLYLVNAGHKVTVLTRQDKIASDANQIHFYHALKAYWSERENFAYITRAKTTSVSGCSVTYVGEDGAEKTISCDSVVMASGVEPCQAEALNYFGLAKQFFLAGDCRTPGRVYDCTRSAFAAASQI